MITVRKHIVTETAHRLLDYVGKCAHVHGHSYKWEVELGGHEQDMPHNGILIDFKELKALLQKYVHDVYDHALVLRKDDPLIQSAVAYQALVTGVSADTARVVIHSFNPTAENLATFVGQRFERALVGRVPFVRLVSFTVWETENSFARYVPEAVRPETYR